jgi:hypothetical protein
VSVNENGYIPAGGGLSVRGFLRFAVWVAVAIAISYVLQRFIGVPIASNISHLLIAIIAIVWLAPAALHPERQVDVFTEQDARATRRAALFVIVIFIIIASSAIFSLVTE